MDLASIMFFIMAGIILFSSYKMVTAPNPIMCALALAGIMITLAGMFYTLNAPFIAAVQLIIYAGAVMVLFVMVLMLFDLETEKRAFTRGAFSGFLKLVAAGALGGLIFGIASISTDVLTTVELASAIEPDFTQAKDLAALLFTRYLFAFEALGLLLLLVAVGVVAVSRIKGGTHAKH